MEINEQTKKELDVQQKLEFDKWNKEMNDVAIKVVDLLRDKQLTVHEFNQVLKLVQSAVGNNIGQLNVNYIINSAEKAEVKKEKEPEEKKEEKLNK